MRYVLPCVLLLLAACESAPPYASHPLARTVKSDGHVIHVIPQSNNVYAAFGGEDGKDGHFIQYRQQRAIEIVSGCRIRKVISAKGEPLLKASVRCK